MLYDDSLRPGMSPGSVNQHIGQLAQAGLIGQRREGRSLIYSADYRAMQGLVDFLTENCCGGASCAPAPASLDCES